jgi:hypothetical protein
LIAAAVFPVPIITFSLLKVLGSVNPCWINLLPITMFSLNLLATFPAVKSNGAGTGPGPQISKAKKS